MKTHATGSIDHNGAGTLVPAASGIGSAGKGRSFRQTTGIGLVSIVAIGTCLGLAPVASAQSAGIGVAQTGNTLSSNDSATNLPAWPVLSQGTNSSWPAVTVRSLQHLLNAHGASLDVDGVFGAKTDAGVRAFQRTHGLVVDGVAGANTWSALIITVQRGNVGPAVKVVQDQSSFRHLTPDGTDLLAIDGVFGPKTEEWVRDFQTTLAFNSPTEVDGIVGPMTWRALISGVFAE
jgi:peptidoglycan hydrolase-like protein with peptidoglycan-binding domain